MNMEFKRKLPIPKETKEMFPLTPKLAEIKSARDKEIKAIFESRSDKLALIIGPCSADREDSVLDYIHRLAKIQEEVKYPGQIKINIIRESRAVDYAK